MSSGWTPLTNGTVNLTAVATDNWGDTAQASLIFDTGYAPTAALLNPTNGQIFAVGQPIQFRATAADIDGFVQFIDFNFYSEALWDQWIAWWNLASVTGPDFEYSWIPAAYCGNTLLLSVSALDNHYLYGSGSPHIVVFISNAGGSDNSAPCVSLTSPTNNLLLSAPTNLVLRATASDPGGSISKVEFYDGGNRSGALRPKRRWHLPDGMGGNQPPNPLHLRSGL